jgi:single-stranded-DNA-specific exonuclease
LVCRRCQVQQKATTIAYFYPMEKRWNLREADDLLVNELQKSLGIHKALCQLLVKRGMHDFETSKAYFRPSIKDLHSPWLMKDMAKAVERLLSAFRTDERILVYGDYDVDGTTSVACMFNFLKSIHSPVEFYIPHRYREGYGISKTGIDFAADNEFTLIVSLDCGIKAIEMIEYAQSKGIEFIVCDHHMPDETLPAAVAILNAKQVDCPYPFKELCGCGVGFKLIQALCEKLNLPDSTWMQYLDLVATAIAADIVPMIGENRVLTYYGLEKVNNNPSTGIKALMDLSEMKGIVQVANLVFIIAPRVNAAGRMDDARKAVLLFVEQDYNKALDLAKQLHTDNTERRETDTTITEQAIALIENDQLLQTKKSTVLYQSDWHKGVVGIVASRLIEKYYKPTIVLTNSNGKVSGSARSVSGFNVYEAIHQCKDLLENYGGHFYAAGLTMKTENVDLFTSMFENVVSTSIPDELLIPEVVIDATIKLSDITPTFYKIICQMEPFGPENMRPVFMAKNVYETGYSRIVKQSHIKFSLKQDNCIIDGIGFGMAEKYGLLQPNVPLDIVFTLDENEWNGEKKIQLKMIDIKRH